MIPKFLSKLFRNAGTGRNSSTRKLYRRIAIEPLETRRLLAATGSIAGYVYLDPTSTGQYQSSDAGFPGLTVELDSVSSTGSLSLVSPGGIAQTAADGSYSFTGLAAGTYELQISPSSRLSMGTVSPGSGGGTAGTNDIQLTLTAGQAATDYNFGVVGAQQNYISLRADLASTGSLSQFLTTSLLTAPTVMADSTGGASGTGSSTYSTTYTVGDSAVSVAPNATITATESSTLLWMTATIASPSSSETLAATTSSTGLTSNYSDGVLTIAGSASAATYQTVLRSLTYSTTSASDPVTITVLASDGSVTSTAITSTITVNAGNEPSGYTIAANQSEIGKSAASSTGFTFSGATTGDTYNYTVTSSGGTGSVTGSGTVTSASQDVTGINVSTLSDGTLTFSVTLTSTSGVAGTAATATATLDQTAPTGYTITANQSAIGTSTVAATGFTFAGAEVGDTYNYTITSSVGTGSVTGSGTVTSASEKVSGIDVSALSDGTLTFSVTLTDLAGNVGTAATTTATLDRVAPSGYSITAQPNVVAAGNDTDAGFIFAGAEVGDTYNYTVTGSGGSVTGSGTVTSATQSVTGINVSGLSDGTLTFSVTLTDAAANVGTATTATGTLDKEAPSGYSISLVKADLNGTTGASAAFTFAGATTGDTYNYMVISNVGTGSVTGSGTVTSASETVSGINVTTLSDGNLTFSVSLTSPAGNTGATVTASGLLDRVAPSGYTIAANQSTVNASDATNTGFTFSNAEVGDTYNYTITSNGGSGSVTNSGTVTSAGEKVTGINVSSLQDGELSFSVTLTDPSGNVGTAALASAALDTTLPSGYSITADLGLINASAATAAGFTFAGATTGDTYNYTVTSNGGTGSVTASGTVTSAGENVSAINVSGLANGTLTYNVTLTDPAGNTGAATTATATLQKTAPSGYTISLVTADLNATTGQTAAFQFSGATTGDTYTYTVTSSGGAGSVTNSGTVTSAGETVNGINVTTLSDGTLTFSVTLTDAAGNVGSAATATGLLDRVAPSGYTIAANQSTVNAAAATSTGFTFTDAEVGDTYNYTITSSGGTGSVTSSGTVSSASEKVTGINVSSLSDGTLSFSVTLTDPSGNQGNPTTCTATLNTAIPTGYSITPDNSTINSSEAGSTGFTFAGATTGDTYHYTITSASGGGSVTSSGSVTAASENVTGIDVAGLPDGVLTFSVTLTNAVGNTGAAATATATLATAAPNGYSITADNSTINATEAVSAGFTFAHATTGTTYDYTVTSSGGTGSVTGSGSVSSPSQGVTGIDVAGLADGTLTFSVTLTNAVGDTGQAATATATLDTTIPSGYSITANQSVINAAADTNTGFTFAGATVGDIYHFIATTSDGVQVIGSGTVTSATQKVTSVNVTTLPDGLLTFSVTLTDAAGNLGNPATATATLDKTLPSGYSVTPSATVYGEVAAEEAGFTINSAEVGDTYNYTITSTGGGETATGSGTVTSASQTVSGIDLLSVNGSEVSNGTLTFSVTLTDSAGNQGTAATANAVLNTVTPPAYTVTPDQNPITAPANFGFTFGNAEVDDTYNYAFLYQGTAMLRGSGTVTSSTMDVTGQNVSTLPSGQYVLHVIITNPADNATAENAVVTVNQPVFAFTIAANSHYVNSTTETNAGFTFANAETLTTYNYSVTSSNGGGTVTGSGSVYLPTQSVTGINVSSLNDGLLTYTVTLTDMEGNTLSESTTAVLDRSIPSGYTITANAPSINLATAAQAGFQFAGATLGDTYNYKITSSGGSGSVTGSGTITSATQTVSSLNVSSLASGTLTYSVTLSDVAGNVGAAETASAALDTTTPSGYSITPALSLINANEAASTGFIFAGATTNDTYQYTVTSSGGAGSATGSGTVTSATQGVTGIDVSGLPDGTLTYSVTLTSPGGNVGAAVTTTATLDQTAPAGYTVSAIDPVITTTTAGSTGFILNSAEVGDTYDYTITSSNGGATLTGSGTISSASQTVAGIDVSGLNDGSVTYSVTLTDTAGNIGDAATGTATLDRAAPTGYAISSSPATVNEYDATDAGFTITGATVTDTYNYTVTSSGGAGSATGSGTITAATQAVSGIDVHELPNGTLTFSVTLTGNGHAGAAATSTATLDTIAPSGFTVTPDQTTINAVDVTSAGFSLAGAEVGATYNYTVTDGVGGSVTGSGSVTAATQDVTGINLSSLAAGSVTFSVTLTDTAGNISNPVTAIATIDPNDPTAIALSSSSAPDGAGSGTFVALLGTVGPQSGATYTYALADTADYSDNSSFQIVGNELLTNTTLNSSLQSSYTILLQSTDSLGNSIQQPFTITVNAADPIAATLTLTSTGIAAGQPSGTLAGTLSASGAIIGNTINYSLVDSADYPANSMFYISGDQLLTNGPLAADTSYTVRVRSSSTFLASDIADISTPPGLTGPYVAQVSLASTVFNGLSSNYLQVAANAGLITLATDGAGTGNWYPAITVNKSAPGSLAQVNYQGSYASFWASVQAAHPSATLADIVGSSGVDLANNEVWAVVDQTGSNEFAVADTVFTEQALTITPS